MSKSDSDSDTDSCGINDVDNSFIEYSSEQRAAADKSARQGNNKQVQEEEKKDGNENILDGISDTESNRSDHISDSDNRPPKTKKLRARNPTTYEQDQ